MKKRIFRISAFLISLCLLIFFGSSVNAAKKNNDPMIKVGLAYGNNAMPGPKLLNMSGQDEGYSFGWYDSDRDFNEVGWTGERAIAILKDKTVYMSEGEVFSSSEPSDLRKTIYPCHAECDEIFDDFDEAQRFADELIEEGTDAFPAYINGDYVVRAGESSTISNAGDLADEYTDELGYDFYPVGASETCYTVVDSTNGSILFEFDMDGQPFGIMPYSENTWFSGYNYLGGFEYNRVNGNDVTVINVIGLHDYIKGVIANEMSPSWHIEALKAQALCAKSYCVTNLGKHSSLGFDICDTTDCQVYYGTRQQTANSDKAVDDTYGLYIKYEDEPISAFYHASSGGYTEDAKNVWGTEVDYLKAVKDRYLEKTLPYSFTITASQIKSILKSKGYSVTDITDYYVSEYTEAGNVRAVTFVQSSGKELTFTGERARTILNGSSYGFSTNSQRYTVTATIGAGIYINDKAISDALSGLFAIGAGGVEKIGLSNSKIKVLTGDGIESLNSVFSGSSGSSASGSSASYYVSGSGSGHNVGLCQWGAKAMADKGFDFEEILEFYYTDIEIGTLD